MRKSYPPPGIEPAAFGLTIKILTANMGVCQFGPSKFKLFKHSSKTHETLQQVNVEERQNQNS